MGYGWRVSIIAKQAKSLPIAIPNCIVNSAKTLKSEEQIEFVGGLLSPFHQETASLHSLRKRGA